MPVSCAPGFANPIRAATPLTQGVRVESVDQGGELRFEQRKDAERLHHLGQVVDMFRIEFGDHLWRVGHQRQDFLPSQHVDAEQA